MTESQWYGIPTILSFLGGQEFIEKLNAEIVVDNPTLFKSTFKRTGNQGVTCVSVEVDCKGGAKTYTMIFYTSVFTGIEPDYTALLEVAKYIEVHENQLKAVLFRETQVCL